MKTQKRKTKWHFTKFIKNIFILLITIYFIYIFININIDIFTKMSFIEFLQY